jgi:hypothetical protein
MKHAKMQPPIVAASSVEFIKVAALSAHAPAW